MGDIRKIKVRLEGTGGQKAIGEIEIRAISSSERTYEVTKRALLGLCITAATVFIPIVHFISIPLGLLITSIYSLNATRNESQILGGTSTCPYCTKEISIMKRFAKGSFSERCEHCLRESVVELEFSSTF